MARGGPRANSGGARPGAGRPTSAILDYRREMQRRATEVASEDDVDAILRTAIGQAREGDNAARMWLTPFLFGKVADELKLSGDEESPLHIIVDG